MFGIGLPEMAVIAIVAFLAFGPDRMPEFARQAGRALRQIRAWRAAMESEITSTLGPEFAALTSGDIRSKLREHVEHAVSADADAASEEEAGAATPRDMEGERTPEAP